jgi:hypothetical protein
MDKLYPWRSVRGWWYSPCITAEVTPRMPYHRIQGTSENEVPLTDARNRPQGGPTSRHKEAASRKLYHSIEGTSLKEGCSNEYKETWKRLLVVSAMCKSKELWICIQFWERLFSVGLNTFQFGKVILNNDLWNLKSFHLNHFDDLSLEFVCYCTSTQLGLCVVACY